MAWDCPLKTARNLLGTVLELEMWPMEAQTHLDYKHVTSSTNTEHVGRELADLRDT